jgi:hypothetical protein
LQGASPVGFLVRTRTDLIALDITRSTEDPTQLRFRYVVLSPRGSTAQPTSSFDPVVERTLPLADTPGEIAAWLNLETGAISSTPPGLGVWQDGPEQNFWVVGQIYLSDYLDGTFDATDAAAVKRYALSGHRAYLERHGTLPGSGAGLRLRTPRPASYVVVTEGGRAGLLETIGLNKNPRGVRLRYKLVAADERTRASGVPPTAAASDPKLRSYAVGKTYTALAANASGRGPEHIQARAALGLLEGDPATVLAEHTFGLAECPPGSITFTMTAAEAAILRNTEVLRVMVQDDDLAVVVMRSKGVIVSTVHARHDGTWKVFADGDLPDAPTEEEAVTSFFARVEALRADIAKTPARDPKLLEQATAEMAEQLGIMMGTR